MGNSRKTNFRSVRLDSFKKQFYSLPRHVQEIAQQLYGRFKENPRDPFVQIKPVQSKKGHYELRITASYRAVCWIEVKQGLKTYIWYFIGTHNEFDKKY